MKLGIFGGSFDPPHCAHLILAAEAHFQLALDRVLWVLTPFPPHKQFDYITPWSHRLEMLEVIIKGDPDFDISRADIDRPAPHYALDTMRSLREEYPDEELIYLMGGDSLHDLPEWHHPLKFIEICDGLGVMRRPGDRIDLSILEDMLPGVAEKVRFIDTPLIDISASQIRKRVATGAPYRYYVPQAIYQIIKKYNLYMKGNHQTE